MNHGDDLLAVFVVAILFVGGLVVYPFIKTERFRVTPLKALALVIAIGICIYDICIYNGTFAFLLAFLWPLSLIWFPEYWGNYTGFMHGLYVDQKSPPILISLIGWLFLVVLPPLLLWITGR